MCSLRPRRFNLPHTPALPPEVSAHFEALSACNKFRDVQINYRWSAIVFPRAIWRRSLLSLFFLPFLRVIPAQPGALSPCQLCEILSSWILPRPRMRSFASLNLTFKRYNLMKPQADHTFFFFFSFTPNNLPLAFSARCAVDLALTCPLRECRLSLMKTL